EKTVATLLEARALITGLAESGSQWAKWKLEEIDQTIALCLGLRTEAQADTFAYVPGATAKLQLSALNRSPLPVTLTRIHVSGWGETDVPIKNKTLAYNKVDTNPVSLTVPAKQPLSQPFWLREPNNGNWYDIKDQTLIGRADIVPEVTARFDFAVSGGTFSITEPLHFRYADPSKDEFVRPVVVEPPVAIDLPSRNFVFPVGASQTTSMQVRAMVANQSGTLRLELPAGWRVSPASVPFQLKEAGATEEARFTVTPPAEAQTGRFKAIARLQSGTEVATGVYVISYTHIPAQTVMEPSEGSIAAVSLKVLAKRVGYVMGSSDDEPAGLRQMGVQVDLLDEKDLSSGDLSVYDAIITGVRAYSVRPDLRASQARLLEYVKNGGTLVVQYNNNGDRRISPSVAEAFDHLGPYPFTIAGNNARVTEENAPVEYLSNSPLLHYPNEIGHADFDGWVQERGLYFADKWDPRYETPLETHDKGEAALKGSLLYTKYGKGVYIFTAFSWFRQLPAGVPGAYRIFANLISAGKTGH
ncbi:MAG: NEW3 domain-containing protein, partial [Terriglobia bacterium]